MALNSPLANPRAIISKINNLSAEAIAVDESVDRSKRDAAAFAAKYSADFEIASELQASTEQFSVRWVGTLQQTRDAASAISAWYQRFDRVFLSLVDDIATEVDAKETIQEFNSFLGESNPSNQYQLGKTPGVKNTWDEVEELARQESNYIIDVLKKATGKDVKKIIDDLKKELGPVKNGVEQVRQALNSYAGRVN